MNLGVTFSHYPDNGEHIYQVMFVVVQMKQNKNPQTSYYWPAAPLTHRYIKGRM